MIKKQYEKVVTGNVYDLERANDHTCSLANSGIKAKDMPEEEAKFVKENHAGCCLHYSMYLIELLHNAGVECYFTITPEEDGTNHCSVLYKGDNGEKYIADPVADVKDGTVDRHMCIEYDEFVSKAIRNEISHYDLFGEHGEEAFFGAKFLSSCKLESIVI